MTKKEQIIYGGIILALLYLMGVLNFLANT